jgi:tRNA nucleotidyltransferase/poly(A) polymerase
MRKQINESVISNAQNFSYETLNHEFPIINGNNINGLIIRNDVPNMNSIEASLTNYEILNGIREVSFNSFPQMGDLKYYSPDEEQKTKKLAKQIEYNKEISPLIVVIDEDGSYVLEGGHRFDALRELGISSFPAKVVFDLDSINIAENMCENNIQPNNKITEFVNNLKQKPFIQSLINDLGSEIYAVGGVVRDLVLNKPNKDIDLIVRNTSIDLLISQLQKFGKVDVVGKSFGVIKFIDKDGTDYDIALPRKEKPNGEGGYHGFDVQSDENLPIEDDLTRRDAKLNAMAININSGKFIDPLGGLEDIKNKQISAANPQAFSDDPLRMMRMIGFASRFDFTIEPQTMQMIKDNASRIKEIPPERILIEFDKILKKGDKRIGIQLLKDTGLFQQIFNFDLKQSTIDRSPFEEVKTIGEFIYLLIRLLPNPAEFYKNNLKGDIDTYKEIKALEMAFDSGEATNLIEARTVVHNMYVTSPQSLQSQIIPSVIETAAQELLQGKYPKAVGELAINGNDLIQFGLKGKEIGDMLKSLLLKVYSNNVRNNRDDLLNLTSQKNKSIKQEGVADKYAEKTFNVPDSNTAMDVKAMGGIEKNKEKPYAISEEGDLFFKNPKSLTNFDKNVRAIADSDGNLFVAQSDGAFNHADMADILGITEYVYNNFNYQVLQRVSDSNNFGLSDSGEEFIQRGEDQKETSIEILRATKRKNPQYDFYLEYYGLIKYGSMPINLTEEYHEVGDGKYVVNNKIVDINFFAKEYDIWNTESGRGRAEYSDPNEASVLEFLQNNYEDFSHNEKLKHKLLWKLTDNDVLNETPIDSITSDNIITPQYIKDVKRSDNYERYIEYYKYENNLEDEDKEVIEQNEDFKEWFIWELKYKYDDVIDKIKEKIKPNDTIDIWREMTVDDNWIYHIGTQGKHLGIYWSWEENAAEAHWGDSKKYNKAIIKTSVKEDNIDWTNTIYANMDLALGEDEKEITLFKNTSLKIEELYINGEDIMDSPQAIPIKNKIFYA